MSSPCNSHLAFMQIQVTGPKFTREFVSSTVFNDGQSGRMANRIHSKVDLNTVCVSAHERALCLQLLELRLREQIDSLSR